MARSRREESDDARKAGARWARGRRKAVRRSDDADAFMPDPDGGPARAPDDLAEELAEEFVLAATSGEDAGTAMGDAMTDDEVGGLLVAAGDPEEFADDTDDWSSGDAMP